MNYLLVNATNIVYCMFSLYSNCVVYNQTVCCRSWSHVMAMVPHDVAARSPWTVCVPLLRVKGSITALLSLRTVLFNYLIIYWNCYKTAGIQLNWIKFWKSMHCFFYSWVNCIKKLKKIYSYWFYIFNGGLLKYSAYIQTWHMRSRSCTLVVLVK